jgi:phosphate transport system substrate-binding protein
VKRSTLSRAVLPAAVVLSLALTACGASNEDDGNDAGASSGGSASAAADLTGSLAGAGSSAQAAAQEAWVAGFNSTYPDVSVNYDPVGSGGGREQFIAGGTDFAGTDSYFSDDEGELSKAKERCGGDIVEVPAYLSPIALPFNIEGVDALNLGPEEVAGIFAQKITKWNDPALTKINPDVKLPNLKITPVNRSDESGTTNNFQQYLVAAAPDVWTYEPDDIFPVKGGEAAQGTSGVVAAVEGGNGTIGYADASQIGDLPAAKVGVGGEFIAYSPEAAAKVLEVSTKVEGRGATDLAYDLARDTEESGTYPIVLLSYAVACPTYDDKAKADLVKAYLTYITSSEGQQAAAESAGSAPLSQALLDQIAPIVEGIKAG